MHPVLQFLDHMFGGGQPAPHQAQPQHPQAQPIRDPASAIAPHIAGMIQHYNAMAKMLPQPQLPQQGIAPPPGVQYGPPIQPYPRIQQPRGPQQLEVGAPIAQGGGLNPQSVQQAPGYQQFDTSGGPQQFQVAQGGVQGSAPQLQNRRPIQPNLGIQQ